MHTISAEAKEFGWHPAENLFYEYKDKCLIIGLMGAIPEEAKQLGFACSKSMPYYPNSSPGCLHVTRYSPMSSYPPEFIEAGWHPAVSLPFDRYFEDGNICGLNILKVWFDVNDPEYADAIALGWHPPCSI